MGTGVRITCPADGSTPDGGKGPYTSSGLPTTTLVLMMTANNFGYLMADVAADSLSIDWAKREHPDKKGEIQGMCYTIRAAGFVVAYTITAFAFNGPITGGQFEFELSIPQYLWVLVALQCVGLPFWWMLHEDRQEGAQREEGEHNIGMIYKLLQNRAMTKMMIFNIIMNLSQQVLVNARNTVLDTWVGMSPFVNSMDQILTQFIQMATLFAAAKWLKKYNWRHLLIGGLIFWTVFQLLFWFVVFDESLRQSWFVIMIDLDQTFGQNLGYLVIMWAVVPMAPDGIEGSTLALATTVGNAGQAMGQFVLIFFNHFFQLSKRQIADDQSSTRWQYAYNSLAVIAVQWAYVLAMGWMPTGYEMAKQRYQAELGKESKAWANLGVFLICFAVIWGTLSTIMAFACPCNSLFGGAGCSPGFFSCGSSQSVEL